MGANLCCGRPSSPKPKPQERTYCDQHVCLPAASSRVDFIEPPPPPPPCLSKEQRKQPCSSPEKKKMMTPKEDIRTLKDCILASSATSPQIIKQLPKVICISSPEGRAEFFTPRNSCSSPQDGVSPGRLVMIDERDEDESYEVGFKLAEETLKDCLLGSSGGMLSPQFITESDFQIIKQLPKVIYVSSPSGPSTEFFTPRDSFCSPRDGLFSPGRAVRIGEGDEQLLVYLPNKMSLGFKLHEDSLKDEEELASSSVTSRHGQIGKPRKTVTFNLP